MRLNSLVLNIIFAVFVGSGSASAAEFTGSAVGCFGASCSSFSAQTNDDDLRFDGASQFSQAINPTGTITLGQFLLTGNKNITNNMDSDTFKLKVAFTSPQGTSPGPVIYTADLDASIVSGPDSLKIDFSNAPHSFSFTGGTFTLAIQDVFLSEMAEGCDNGSSYASLVGSIVVTPAVPEPSTWAMMIIGFAGVGFMTYRRKRNHLAVAG